MSSGLRAAKRLIFGLLGAWYVDTQLSRMAFRSMLMTASFPVLPPSQTYELLTGQILFQPQPTEDLTADESLLLLQYAFTGETLDSSLTRESRLKDQYFDSEGGS
jgi:hypothetical protein